MRVESYLFFKGQCEEAMNFYKDTVGLEVLFMMRFSESPDQSMTQPGMEDKIMHASVKIGDTPLMMSDGDCNGEMEFKGSSLSIGLDNEDEAKRIFDAMSAGGTVTMPLMKTFWSPCFGMFKDKFGIDWMINVDDPDCQE